MKRTPFVHIFILITFLTNVVCSVPITQAQELRLPVPGVMVHLSPPENPPMLKGVIVYPNNPFKFDFILDQGDKYNRHPERSEGSQQEQLKEESARLVKYFLVSITTPENDLWVNLSPYEKDRIIPESFGKTDMGRDLLAEDYILKQITASLIYPEGKIGREFWKRVYEEAQKKYGTTNISVNTFNKVWIVPEHAKVYEHGNTAFVVNAKLKVMLEQDYLSMQKHQLSKSKGTVPLKRGEQSPSVNKNINTLGSQIIREIIIPQLEKEVNEGKNFVTLRQVYNSLILAVWFKKRMKDSILGRKYMDQNKIVALSTLSATVGDPGFIYQRYLQAFKKGVYNYIKDTETPEGVSVPRKYFSGGAEMSAAMITTEIDSALTEQEQRQLRGLGGELMVNVLLGDAPGSVDLHSSVSQAIPSYKRAESQGNVSIDQILKINRKSIQARLRYWGREGVVERVAGLERIGQTNSRGEQIFYFDIIIDHQKVGNIVYRVNSQERTAILASIHVNKGSRRQGIASLGVALLKLFIIDNGFQDLVIHSNHQKDKIDSTYSAAALTSNFYEQGFKSGQGNLHEFNIYTWRILADDPAIGLVRNFGVSRRVQLSGSRQSNSQKMVLSTAVNPAMNAVPTLDHTWRPKLEYSQTQEAVGGIIQGRQDVVPKEMPVVSVMSQGLVFPETNHVVFTDINLSRKLQQLGITCLMGAALSNEAFLKVLSEKPLGEMIQFLKEEGVYPIEIKLNSQIDRKYLSEAQEFIVKVFPGMINDYPITTHDFVPVVAEYLSQGFNTDSVFSTRNTLLDLEKRKGHVLRYKMFLTMARWNQMSREILAKTGDDPSAIKPLTKIDILSYVSYYSQEVIDYGLEQLIFQWRRLNITDPKITAVFFTLGFEAAFASVSWMPYEHGEIDKNIFRSFESIDRNLMTNDLWITFLNILNQKEINFNGERFSFIGIRPLADDIEKGEISGHSPIFMMNLTGQDGEQKSLLVKWTEFQTVRYDQIMTKTARVLEMPSYVVESIPGNEGAWELIEYVPHYMVAFSSGLGFKTPGIDKLLDADFNEVNERLRSLGHVLGLEYLLGVRDAKMKHFLLRKDNQRFCRIDWEYVLDFSSKEDSNTPSVLKGDERDFLRELARYSNGRRLVEKIKEGFLEEIQQGRVKRDDILSIVEENLLENKNIAEIREQLLSNLEKSNQEILEGLGNPFDLAMNSQESFDLHTIANTIRDKERELINLGINRIKPFALRAVSQQYYQKDPMNPFGANPAYGDRLFMVGINPKKFFSSKAWTKWGEFSVGDLDKNQMGQIEREFLDRLYNTFITRLNFGNDGMSGDDAILRSPVFEVFRGFYFPSENQEGETKLTKTDFSTPENAVSMEETKTYQDWYSQASVSLSEVRIEHEVFSTKLSSEDLLRINAQIDGYIDTVLIPFLKQKNLLYDTAALKYYRGIILSRYIPYFLYSRFLTWLVEDAKVQEASKAMVANKVGMTKFRQNIPGGIDLTAKRIHLDVDSDKAMSIQAMNLKTLENIEINGLYIKDIEIKPLNNLPELLGISPS